MWLEAINKTNPTLQFSIRIIAKTADEPTDLICPPTEKITRACNASSQSTERSFCSIHFTTFDDNLFVPNTSIL